MRTVSKILTQGLSTYGNTRQPSPPVEHYHRQEPQHIRKSKYLGQHTHKLADNQRDMIKLIKDNSTREPSQYLHAINDHISNNPPSEQTLPYQTTVPHWEWRKHILPPDDPRSSMFTRDTQPRVIPSAPPLETPRINIEPNSMDRMKTSTYVTSESCPQHRQSHCLNQECINQKNFHSHPQRMWV